MEGKTYEITEENLKLLISVLLNFMTEEQLMKVEQYFDDKGLNIKDFTN
jgi:hypothetical protein